ncbi:pyruvate, phosphate dikinase [bacterium (Candidatus Gribaldobacteria) CG_4_10_14_0_2_um_filter_33_15]|nr:MAG: pyruvate, phosphate dikinase [bacterium (Candidatus Gribaldobacteria) CG_4_10_14_0_2_um_filter_33_15]
MSKYVYLFGGGKTEGNAKMKNLLGGKGANLCEMAGAKDLKLPVPPGFIITTEVCNYYYKHNKKYPKGFETQIKKGLAHIEKIMKRKFGDSNNPLLVSIRSGARKSMPGMMETVLNIGLTEETISGLIKKTNNPRFIYDAYRRLIQMYSDVVMEKAEGLPAQAGKKVKDGNGIRAQLEKELEKMKKAKKIKQDTELTADDLKELIKIYKEKVREILKEEFLDEPEVQLEKGIAAVFLSWNGRRAVAYRRIEGIPDDWGTAVSVQAMVFGNTGNNSGTGVAFTRNPATGEKVFYGEWLPDAQGEDVVAGIRTPYPINEKGKTEYNKKFPSLEKQFPKIYKELDLYQRKLEKHYCDMLDIEFTIEDGRLWMLQCRVGKRNGVSTVKMAVDMLNEKLISQKEAVLRVSPEQLNELLHPLIDPKKEKEANLITSGLPAGPGAAVGQVVFTAEDAVVWLENGKPTILVREETNPEDIEGMRAAVGILTARGGMTSHAALVARGWGKCCIVGAGALEIDYKNKILNIEKLIIKEGDWLTLNGTKGYVYLGKLPLIDSVKQNPYFGKFMKICDSLRKLKVRTNADTPKDARKARDFGVEGIGLFRIEHMFYGENSEKPLFLMRKMIMAESEEERIKVLEELYPYVKENIKETLKVMKDLPVTIRLIDPPLHEFVPKNEKECQKLIKELGISREKFEKRAEFLAEVNPMMGHRGVRLGISYPELTRYQTRAIFEAAVELIKRGIKVFPEIMIPVVAFGTEILDQKKIIEEVYRQTIKKFKIKEKQLLLNIGTMIEIPRACLVADQLAKICDFFSFGTNDLTQMGLGFSRDDAGEFLPTYFKKAIIKIDPFQSIDKTGLGELIKIGIKKGRETNPNLKIGICGEHGGDAESVKFCHEIGMNYVSCSPYRVPIAKLALAQAVVENYGGKRSD